MSNRRVDTIKLGQGEYARVPMRLKMFREDCPRGSIETEPTIMEDGNVMFRAYVRKDKKDPNSADSVGHSFGGKKSNKDFEKLETIAVGRALANLGYLASGEIASAEEMEQYLAYQEEQRQKAVNEAIDKLEKAKTIPALKKAFVSLGILVKEKEVIKAKDRLKKELTKKEKK